MPWPNAATLTTHHLDSATDNPGNARSEILSVAEATRMLVNARATQEQAVAGTSNDTILTPLRAKQQTTARISTQEQAEAGEDNETLLTPLRGKQLIDVSGSKVLFERANLTANFNVVNVGDTTWGAIKSKVIVLAISPNDNASFTAPAAKVLVSGVSKFQEILAAAAAPWPVAEVWSIRSFTLGVRVALTVSSRPPAGDDDRLLDLFITFHGDHPPVDVICLQLF